MDKIASSKELQAELRRLLAYSEGPNPSREKVAAELAALAERVASSPKVATTVYTQPQIDAAVKLQREQMNGIEHALTSIGFKRKGMRSSGHVLDYNSLIRWEFDGKGNMSGHLNLEWYPNAD